MKDSGLCDNCKDVVETTEHFFFRLPNRTNFFWLK